MRDSCTLFLNMVLFLIIMSFPQAGLASDNDFEQGTWSYAHKQYGLAAYHFLAFAKQYPENADIHYRLANALAALHDRKDAIDEYELCLQFHPSSQEWQFARTALQGYGVLQSLPIKNQDQAKPNNAIESLAQMEKQLLQRVNNNSSVSNRVVHLEQMVFGVKKSGALSQRIEALAAVLNKQTSPVPVTTKRARTASLSPNPNLLFSQAMQYYLDKAYHAAEENLEVVCSQSPDNQNAHYWLGKVRVNLNDLSGAQNEFQTAFNLNPFSFIGQEAKQNMLDQVSSLAIRSSPPVDPNWMAEQTINRISDQAHDAIGLRLSDGEQAANWRLRQGNREAAKIAAEMQGYRDNDYDYYNYLNWDPNDEISNWTQLRTSHPLSDARVQANLAQQDGLQRSSLLQESANNLYSLLAEPWRPGSPHLRAFGTSLYVRYYGNERPGDPGLPPADPPLKAVALRYSNKS